jgi:hypothetical protein
VLQQAEERCGCSLSSSKDAVRSAILEYAQGAASEGTAKPKAQPEQRKAANRKRESTQQNANDSEVHIVSHLADASNDR